jgi:hypothetical protein
MCVLAVAQWALVAGDLCVPGGDGRKRARGLQKRATTTLKCECTHFQNALAHARRPAAFRAQLLLLAWRVCKTSLHRRSHAWRVTPVPLPT